MFSLIFPSTLEFRASWTCWWIGVCSKLDREHFLKAPSHSGSKSDTDLEVFRPLEISPELLDQKGIVPSFRLPAQGVGTSASLSLPPRSLCSWCLWPLHGPFQRDPGPYPGPRINQGLTMDRREAVLGKGLTYQLGRDISSVGGPKPLYMA